MLSRRKSLALGLSGVLVGIAWPFALPLGAANAAVATVTLAQLASFHEMVVDDVGGHASDGYIFLSQGLDSSALGTGGPSRTAGIVVTDLSGNYVTTLDEGYGAEGLAVSPDGDTLYAAMSRASAIAAIDVSSITPATTIPSQRLYNLPSQTVPYDVAVQSGKLFASFNPAPYLLDQNPNDLYYPVGQSTVGYFDLSQPDPAFQVPTDGTGYPVMGQWYSAPGLAADPSDTGELIASDESGTPAQVASYDVAGDTVTVRAQQQRLAAGTDNSGDPVNCAWAGPGNVAVVPGGGQVIIGCGSPYAHFSYSTADLSLLGRYATTDYSGATAIASGTGLLALGASDPYAPDIYVYDPTGSTLLNAYDFGESSTDSVTLASGGLALSPDGRTLYALTTSQADGYVLHVFDAPGQPATSLTLTPPATVYAGYVTINGLVTLATGPAAYWATVTVSRTDAAGNTVSLPSVHLAQGGTFAVTDDPATGSYTYTATYKSSSGTTVAAKSLAVNVLPNTSAITATGSVKGSGAVTVRGTLTFNGTPAPAGTTITVSRNEDPSLLSATPLPSVTTGSGGAFTVTDKPGFAARFVYTVTYPGDAAHGAATATVTLVTTK